MAKAKRAARLCKADLLSEVVGEFPELQGLMGRYYAEEQGEDEAVAHACEDHYKPKGPDDLVPSDPVSVAVALADKIDTLVGFWAIDEKPTGSKDPYALRRAALGCIRLILENNLRVPTRKVLRKQHSIYLDCFMEMYALCFRSETGSFRTYFASGFSLKEPAQEKPYWWVRKHSLAHPGIEEAVEASGSKEMFDAEGFIYFEEEEPVYSGLINFFADRLKVQLREQGARHDLVDAVFALDDQDDLLLIVRRVEALGKFLDTEDGKNLLAGYKRATNIIRIEEKKDDREYTGAPELKFYQQAEEKVLAKAIDAARTEATRAVEKEDFEAAMRAMAKLRPSVDAFFDKVTVNIDEKPLRENRLKLLNEIRAATRAVADFSRIEG